MFIFVSDAQYRKQINEAILKMQESSALSQLKDKWWTEMHGGGKCKVRFSKGIHLRISMIYK